MFGRGSTASEGGTCVRNEAIAAPLVASLLRAISLNNRLNNAIIKESLFEREDGRALHCFWPSFQVLGVDKFHFFSCKISI